MARAEFENAVRASLPDEVQDYFRIVAFAKIDGKEATFGETGYYQMAVVGTIESNRVLCAGRGYDTLQLGTELDKGTGLDSDDWAEFGFRSTNDDGQCPSVAKIRWEPDRFTVIGEFAWEKWESGWRFQSP